MHMYFYSVELSGRSFGALYSLWLSDWWNFLHSIMGIVVFTTNFAIKHDYLKK